MRSAECRMQNAECRMKRSGRMAGDEEVDSAHSAGVFDRADGGGGGADGSRRVCGRCLDS